MTDVLPLRAVPYRKDKTIPVPALLTVPVAVASARDRLVASRQRIRAELMLIAHPPAKPSLTSRVGSLQDKVKLWWRRPKV